MKVLVVAPQPFYQERGTPIAVRLLVETLCRAGHQVDLLVYHDGADVHIDGMRLFRAGRPPGIRHVPIGISWQKLVCDLWLIARMFSLLRQNRYDVVHAVEESVFPAILLTRFSSTPVIYDMDSSLSDQMTDKWRPLRPLGGLLRGIERAFIRHSIVVLAVCEDLAVKVRPWVGADRVVVLPDVPVGDPDPSPVGDSLRAMVPPGAVVGLYAGNLERYQGIDLMLAAIAQLDKDLAFHMIVVGGSSAHIAQYQKIAADLAIADRVQFIGPRPVADLNAYLAQADILLSPRILGQNTPMKVYSYMQSGKAILATDIRSHTQVLNETCAQLVAVDPAAMAAGLNRLARDPQRRQELGNAARVLAEREYSLPVFVNKLQSAYALVARA